VLRGIGDLFYITFSRLIKQGSITFLQPVGKSNDLPERFLQIMAGNIGYLFQLISGPFKFLLQLLQRIVKRPGIFSDSFLLSL